LGPAFLFRRLGTVGRQRDHCQNCRYEQPTNVRESILPPLVVQASRLRVSGQTRHMYRRPCTTPQS
jgi:hypothetical protein